MQAAVHRDVQHLKLLMFERLMLLSGRRGTTNLAYAHVCIQVPTAIAKFPADTFSSMPRAWIEQTWNVQQYTEMQAGGHFPALEEPGTMSCSPHKHAANMVMRM